jgi:hypothetical protein
MEKIHYMKTHIRCLLLFPVIASFPFTQAFPKKPFEEHAVFQATDLLPQDLLTSKLHRIEPVVWNDGYLNNYTVVSTFETTVIKGTPNVKNYLRELAAIQLLQDEYPNSKIAISAAKDTSVALVTGPIQGAQRAYDTVTDKEALKDTAKALPGGIANLFGTAAKGAWKTAKVSARVINESVQEETNNEKKAITFQETMSHLGNASLSIIGYNRAYRRLARTLQVDPYTENQILSSQMQRVAGMSSSLQFAAQFAPSLYGIPLANTINQYAGIAEKLAGYEDPEEIAKLNREVLKVLEQIEKFGAPAPASRSFLENEHYTPVLKRMVVDAVQRLQTASDFGHLITLANQADNRKSAEFFASVISYLAEIHESSTPITQILPTSALPIGTTTGQRLVIAIAVDHLLWTSDIAAVFDHASRAATPGASKAPMELHVRGTISQRCKSELKRRGITRIFENAPML